jgi:acyl-CoA thioesterase-1
MEGGTVTAMSLSTGYGRFAAAFNSLLVLLVLCLVPAPISQTRGQTAPAGPPVRIVVLGDSLAAGLGVKPEQSFPSRLEAALKAQGRNVAVLNQGVSGDTTAGGVDRIDWLLGDKPDIVLIELGANDALRGLDPALAERNLSSMIEKLKAAGVTVWLAGMVAPRNFGADYVTRFDGLYKRLADKYQVPLYPFILDGVAQDPALNQPDGLHPNVKGAQAIADRLLPFASANLDAYAQTVHRTPRP